MTKPLLLRKTYFFCKTQNKSLLNLKRATWVNKWSLRQLKNRYSLEWTSNWTKIADFTHSLECGCPGFLNMVQTSLAVIMCGNIRVMRCHCTDLGARHAHVGSDVIWILRLINFCSICRRLVFERLLVFVSRDTHGNIFKICSWTMWVMFH